MLVNGENAEEGLDGVLGQLSSLPSTFPNIVGAKSPSVIPPEITQQFESATRETSPEASLQGLKSTLQQTQERLAPDEVSSHSFVGNLQNSMGTVEANLGNYKEAIPAFNDSINTFLRSGNHAAAENVCKNLAATHNANGTLGEYTETVETSLKDSLKSGDQDKQLRARLELGAINRTSGKHEEAIGHYAAAYDLQQGRVDYDAVRVEQHEVGFSADRKIGTDNIQQCVGVILHDPVSKKAALAHVDRFTDTSSLKDVIANFPPGAKLNAHLVGGRDRSEQGKVVSDDNISRVLGELSKHDNVDIKSADVGDKGAPSGIIFDPKSGKLEHGVPGKTDKTTPLRKLAIKPGPLHSAFDFTKSKEIKAPALSREDQSALADRNSKYAGVALQSGNTETWTANVLAHPSAALQKDLDKANKPSFFRQIGKSAMTAMQNFRSKFTSTTPEGQAPAPTQEKATSPEARAPTQEQSTAASPETRAPSSQSPPAPSRSDSVSSTAPALNKSGDKAASRVSFAPQRPRSSVADGLRKSLHAQSATSQSRASRGAPPPVRKVSTPEMGRS